jgi:hypothetical protein
LCYLGIICVFIIRYLNILAGQTKLCTGTAASSFLEYPVKSLGQIVKPLMASFFLLSKVVWHIFMRVFCAFAIKNRRIRKTENLNGVFAGAGEGRTLFQSVHLRIFL